MLYTTGMENLSLTVLIWMIPLMIWTAIWKAYGLWKAGRNNHLVWFIIMFLLNTAGILPIIYIFFFQDKKKKKSLKVSKKKTKKRSKKK